MSLDQLEYFVAIAEEQNIGRAARRLHISQPPLSRQLQALESELGTTLFQRTPRGVTLLPPGKILLDHARQILSQVRAAKRALDLKNEPTSDIRALLSLQQNAAQLPDAEPNAATRAT